MLSNRVSKVSIQTHLRVDEEAWPPEQPKTFTPLVLIQHKVQRNLKQSTAIAEFVERGHIDKVFTAPCNDTIPKCCRLNNSEPLQEVLNTSNITKEISKLLIPLESNNDPQCILIEGAPGIGKSLLLKEITYRWSKKEILQKFKLVLLVCLRDPAVQQMSLIEHLFQTFCRRDSKVTEIASSCTGYFLKNNGKDLCLLFDGYDEYPEILRRNSLIADILKRKELPCCGLIVSSRPHASVSLREQATIKVDILGFTEGERLHYIKEAMKGQQGKINELIKYLQHHPTINSLCFVPFNIVVLVYLYKQGIPLPKNSAELYSYFVCLTICRHLAKHGHPLQNNIIKLTDLPQPCNKIVQQLSKLSLHALNYNKLIFTLDEIIVACPDISTVPDAINGFGLLQVVEHFGLTGTTMTFNFLHFSIQEYLAANYIIDLPADEALKVIREYFWSDIHFNMFSIYVALTKGQQPSFKNFLSGGKKEIYVSNQFLNTQLHCFRLYRCFYDAGDINISKTIEQSVLFNHKVIDLSCTILTPNDVECITVFLTTSVHKEWVKLNLSDCYIQDHGLYILYYGLCHYSNITISELRLQYNGLTMQSSSMLSEITVKCKVKTLWISGNNITGESHQLYAMLNDSSNVLQELYMWDTRLSYRGAINLFKALAKDNKTLMKLNIALNEITDDVCDTLTTALKRNSSLVKLYMYGNPMTGEAMLKMVNGIKVNNTLEILQLPQCPINPENNNKRLSCLQSIINKKRENRGCQAKLAITFG